MINATYKTKVIEQLFFDRWDSAKKELSDSIVTLDQISQAIRNFNENNPNHRDEPVSDKNPANFFKDIIRKISTGSNVWPTSVLHEGYTGTASIGKGGCFEFVRIAEGQLVAFPSIQPSEATSPIPVSTLGIATLARKLSRAHETWLMQVATKLNIIELHLSNASCHDLQYVELLQMGVKNNSGEIDALYMGISSNGSGVLITVEAKVDDDISSGQIIGQVRAARNIIARTKEDITLVIPLAIKTLKRTRQRTELFVVEFEAVASKQEIPTTIDVVAESIFDLKPHLPNL